LFGNGEGVIHLDPEVSDCALDLAMSKQKLDCAEIAGPSVDKGRLGAAQGVSAVEHRV